MSARPPIKPPRNTAELSGPQVTALMRLLALSSLFRDGIVPTRDHRTPSMTQLKALEARAVVEWRSVVLGGGERGVRITRLGRELADAIATPVEA